MTTRPRIHGSRRTFGLGATVLALLLALVTAFALRTEILQLLHESTSTSISLPEKGRSPVAIPDRHVTDDIEVIFSQPPTGSQRDRDESHDNIDRRLARLIDSSRRSVHAALYSIESPAVTRSLIEARRRGVDVRLVMESDLTHDGIIDLLDAAEISAVVDHRAGLMHNKFVVVDSIYVWTGSFNPTDYGALRSNNNAVIIASAALAENFEIEFSEMFSERQFGPRSPSRLPHNPVRVGEVDVYSYFAPEDDVPSKIIRIIRASRVSIHFMAFAFTDSRLASALVSRHNSGLDVRGVIESGGASGTGAALAEMRSAGIRILPDGNHLQMHHKVIVVDSIWTITGSYNFTNAAATSNDENIVIIKSRAVALCFENEYGRIVSMVDGVP